MGDLDAIIAGSRATNAEEKQEFLTHGSDSQVNRGNDFFRTLRESILPTAVCLWWKSRKESELRAVSGGTERRCCCSSRDLTSTSKSVTG